jgi:hypothetical protein
MNILSGKIFLGKYRALHTFPHINPLEPCLSSMSDSINHAITYVTRNSYKTAYRKASDQ